MTNFIAMTKARGFTMVEMVATIVVLAITLVAVAGIVMYGTSKSADTLLETRAIALGQAYLDEIIGRRFDEKSDRSGLHPCFGLPTAGGTCTAPMTLGPDAGENKRDNFDDVDDFHGLQEGDGQPTAIADANGDDRTNYDNFYVAVTVRYAGTDAFIGLTDSDAKLITVEVRHRAQTQGWFFSVYRANY
jgi:MSHA pilin protein MshD